MNVHQPLYLSILCEHNLFALKEKSVGKLSFRGEKYHLRRAFFTKCPGISILIIEYTDIRLRLV